MTCECGTPPVFITSQPVILSGDGMWFMMLSVLECINCRKRFLWNPNERETEPIESEKAHEWIQSQDAYRRGSHVS